MKILRGRDSVKGEMKCSEGEGALREPWKLLGLQAECLGDKELMSPGGGDFGVRPLFQIYPPS